MKLSIIVPLLGIGLIAGFIFTRPTSPAREPQPCSKYACIQIKLKDGASYKLNDFRFLPSHCITFVSLPDNINRHYCGDYKLDWIGPQ